MVGLSKLIEGNCHCNLRQLEEGVACFKECLQRRQHLPNNDDHAHVSAFAQYELGAILVRQQDVNLHPTNIIITLFVVIILFQTKEEGKTLLQNVSHYKDYDFEQRLLVRINSMLKHL